MKVELENLLITKIEELTQRRQFYYEFMIVDDSNGQIVNIGEGNFTYSKRFARARIPGFAVNIFEEA